VIGLKGPFRTFDFMKRLKEDDCLSTLQQFEQSPSPCVCFVCTIMEFSRFDSRSSILGTFNTTSTAYSMATNGQELSKYVTLVSSDGFEFVVLREAACVSGAIKRMLDPRSLSAVML
jgi:hypothetical protein